MSPYRRPVPVWYLLLIVVLSNLLIAGSTLWYVRHLDERECAALAAEVAVYREQPPTTATGKKLAAALDERLRVDC